MMKRVCLASCLLSWIALAGCGESEPQSAPPRDRRNPAYTDKTPEEWLKVLRHQSATARNKAIDALLQYGKPTVPGIVGVLEDRSAGPGRLAAARTLGALGADAESAVPALARSLQDRQWSDRDGAAEALGAIRRQPEVAVPALVEALGETDPRVRAVAARALGRIGRGEHGARSEERRVGKEGNRGCRSRWSPYH